MTKLSHITGCPCVKVLRIKHEQTGSRPKESDRNMDELIDPNDKCAKAIREANRWRKPGSGVRVEYSTIKDATSGHGVVGQTVRSLATGELLASSTLPLSDVANGLPLPDMLTLPTHGK